MDTAESRPRENTYFHALVMNLQFAAFHHLGMVSGDEDGEKTVNLDAARDSIEMLRMLQEKTRNNLTTGEENALEQVLYQVQMAFVERSDKEPEDSNSRDVEMEEPVESGESE